MTTSKSNYSFVKSLQIGEVFRLGQKTKTKYQNLGVLTESDTEIILLVRRTTDSANEKAKKVVVVKATDYLFVS